MEILTIPLVSSFCSIVATRLTDIFAGAMIGFFNRFQVKTVITVSYHLSFSSLAFIHLSKANWTPRA